MQSPNIPGNIILVGEYQRSDQAMLSTSTGPVLIQSGDDLSFLVVARASRKVRWSPLRPHRLR